MTWPCLYTFATNYLVSTFANLSCQIAERERELYLPLPILENDGQRELQLCRCKSVARVLLRYHSNTPERDYLHTAMLCRYTSTTPLWLMCIYICSIFYMKCAKQRFLRLIILGCLSSEKINSQAQKTGFACVIQTTFFLQLHGFIQYVYYLKEMDSWKKATLFF